MTALLLAGHDEAQAFIRTTVNRAIQMAPEADALMQSLLGSCAVSVLNMIDHLALPTNAAVARLGWKYMDGVWRAPNALLPDIIDSPSTRIGLRVEAIEEFLAAVRSNARIEGSTYGPYRMATFIVRDEVSFSAVERHGCLDHEPPPLGARTIRKARIHQQIFRTRRRQFQNVERGLSYTLRLAQAAAADLGPEWAGALFARAEREYWQTRSALAASQQQRQREAGVGWCTTANLTYASSREHLPMLVQILEALGYHRRPDLVWVDDAVDWAVLPLDPPPGAPPILVNFDLAPHETVKDILRGPVSPLTWHGRPGIWCALHGESILDAGLHGLSAYYDAARARTLMANDIDHADQLLVMKHPQHDQLVHCEHRAVSPGRTDALEREGYLSPLQTENYRLLGAGASYFSIVPHDDLDPARSSPFFAPDIGIWPSAAESQQPKRARRVRRREQATRRLASSR